MTSSTVVAVHLGRLILELRDIQFAVLNRSGALTAISGEVRPPVSGNPCDEWEVADDVLQLRSHAVTLPHDSPSLEVMGLIFVGKKGLVLARQQMSESVLIHPGDALASSLSVVLTQG